MRMFQEDMIRDRLTPFGNYHPYPTIDERAEWERLSPRLREAQVSVADWIIEQPFTTLRASMFLDYLHETDTDGARRRYEAAYYPRRSRLEQLVITECLLDSGRFLMPILDYLWAILEESYWGVPGHVFRQRAGRTLPDALEPNVDLFSAETANLIAWTYYLLGTRLAQISPVILPRIEHEVHHRLLDPCLERADFHWMGFDQDPKSGRRPNNWNSWICSNWLSCILIIERDQERRAAAVHRVGQALGNFIRPYPEDGGCDEGPQYWDRAAGCLFDSLEAFQVALGGGMGLLDNSKIREMGRYLHRVHIADEYYLNVADSDAVLSPDGPLVYAFGEAIGDDAMKSHGLYLMQTQRLAEVGYASKGDREQNLRRILRGLSLVSRIDTKPVGPPLTRDVWLPITEVMTTRCREGSSQGFFVGAKGGHNRESHNHNDIGSFVVYFNGRPLIVDAGVETYTALTFGPHRYTLWPMRSSYHTLLPTVNGVEQQHGFDHRSSDVGYTATSDSSSFTLDIAAAYPEAAGIDRWQRTITLARGNDVTITDEYRLVRPVSSLALAFLTPCEVGVGELGVIRLDERLYHDGRVSATGKVEYDASLVVSDVQAIPINDTRMQRVWGPALYRVQLHASGLPEHGTLAYRVTGHV